MLFTIENEKQNRMPFHDAHIFREDKTITTSVYHKPTFNGFIHILTAFYQLLISFFYLYILLDVLQLTEETRPKHS